MNAQLCVLPDTIVLYFLNLIKGMFRKVIIVVFKVFFVQKYIEIIFLFIF